MKINSEKSVYPGRRSDMLTACLVVVRHAIEDWTHFGSIITTWNLTYFKDHEQRILDAQSILGVHALEEQVDVSDVVREMLDGALKCLGLFRDCVYSLYGLGEVAEKLLRKLGFGYYDEVRGGSQERLTDLLETFVGNLNQDLEDELVRLGVAPSLIADIRKYREDFTPQNVTQEVEKGKTVVKTSIRQKELNEIYRCTMGICRIGKRLEKDGVVERGRYVMSRIMRRMRRDG